MRHPHIIISHIVILLLLPLTAKSVDFRTSSYASVSAQSTRGISNAPTTTFKSVSTGNYNQPSANTGWQTSSYSVPFAANGLGGGMTTDDMYFESESTSSMRRVRGGSGYNPGYDEGEPGPIGDIPWIMMLLLAGGYIAYTTYSTRKRKAMASAS